MDEPHLKRRIVDAGNSCGMAYKQLLEQINFVCIFHTFAIQGMCSITAKIVLFQIIITFIMMIINDNYDNETNYIVL